ncbi:MAG: helix-turn-helix transcriptional regulator [Kiritimatiellae bacterium]|nr:helix-turn-helix transcriptional regulator [Kiritimatiellia bacterium]
MIGAREFPVRFFIENRMRQRGPYVHHPHVHDSLEIGYCHEGEGLFAIADKILSFRERDTVVVSGVEAHSGQNRPGVTSVWSWLFLDPVRLLGEWCREHALLDTSRLSGKAFGNVLPASAYPAVESLVLRLIDEAKRAAPHFEESVRGCALSLLAEFQRLPGLAPQSCSVSSRHRMDRIEPALRRIQQEYAGKISVPGLARLCHMSESNFRQHFKRVMGKTAYQYVLAYRLGMASIELRDGRKTVEQIADDNGFPTLSCFVRKFKAAEGVAPRAWARQQEGG